MELIVGKDSTWSLRVWINLQIAKTTATELVIDLTHPSAKSEILKYSPAGLVPVLKTDSIVIHDSLAITEYINELSEGALYPKSLDERALARSLCAEMHSGFIALRTNCPFTLIQVAPLSNYGSVMKSKGMKQDIARTEAIFKSATVPFMFDSASAVDSYFAILAFRLNAYGIHFEGKAGEYQDSLLNWPLLQSAIKQAKQWGRN